MSDLQRRESTAVDVVTELRKQTQITDLRDSVTLARQEQEKLGRENARLNEQLRSASAGR